MWELLANCSKFAFTVDCAFGIIAFVVLMTFASFGFELTCVNMEIICSGLYAKFNFVKFLYILCICGKPIGICVLCSLHCI